MTSPKHTDTSRSGGSRATEGHQRMTDDNLEWSIARVIMENRDNGRCIVKDWATEERDNPHVAQALRQARAVIHTIAAMQPAPQWQGIESAPRSLMEQIRLDAALVAAMPEHERRDYERELKALFCNPGITFPTPPAGGSDAE